jgi:FkbM family methyltransferase
MRVVSSVEPDVETAFLTLIKPGDTVFDVGANIGWFSLLAARQTGPRGRVIAFEPLAANVAYVEANARTNGLRNIVTVPVAVADRDGMAAFSPANSLQGKLSDAGQASVPVVTLDSWLATNAEQPPHVVKIDVEDAEERVLRGMREILRTARPSLIIELHGTNAVIADVLDDAGYRHSPLEVADPTRDAPWWVHVLAVPN